MRTISTCCSTRPSLFRFPGTIPKSTASVGRLSTINLHGFQAYLTLGHTRARYFPPETGGLIALGGIPDGVFRIDHDQAYQQNVNLRYQRHKNEEWIDFTWRFDSGLVVSGVPDVAAALALTPSAAGGHRIYVRREFRPLLRRPSEPATAWELRRC